VAGNETAPSSMDAAREGDLIACAQSGDCTAFLALVRHHQEPLYRLVYAMTRREDEAAALVQETFARAWKELPGFPTGRRFFPWLLRIARSLPPSAAPSREERIPQSPALAAFASLQEEERMALALREVGRFRYEEIAALLGVPVGIAFLRISQARGAMLRVAPGETGREP
jgi:DNA-directed RNA polymerase specialized sigma24 family protein